MERQEGNKIPENYKRKVAVLATVLCKDPKAPKSNNIFGIVCLFYSTRSKITVTLRVSSI